MFASVEWKGKNGGRGSICCFCFLLCPPQKRNNIAMQFFLLIPMSRHVIVIVSGHFFTTRHWHSFMKGSEQSHLLQGTKHNTTLFRMPSIWCNSINIYPSPINKHDSLIPKGVKLKYWITIENIKSSSTWLP